MSDAEVRTALETLEARLADASKPLDAASMEAWNRSFQAAVATAERGPGWGELVARAHHLVQSVQARQQEVAVQRDAIRRELQKQLQGARALKGYGDSTR